MRRSTPTAFHGQQAEVTQNVEGIFAVENSEAQTYNLSRSPMWSSRSTANAEPPKFSEDEDRLLRSAIASNQRFSYIKAFIFPDRADISTQALESYARERGALWGEWEDSLVREFLAEGKELDHQLIINLQKWLPWRDLHTLRVRVGYLEKNKLDEEVPRGEQAHDFNTQGDHFGTLDYTVAAPNLSDTNPYAFLFGNFNQNLGHTSAGSARTHPNDHLMNPHGFGIKAIPTDGSARFQQHYNHDVQDDTPGQPVNDPDYFGFGPPVSLPEGAAVGFVDHNTISASSYYNNNPTDLGEYQDMGTPNEAFHQAQQYSNHGIPPYVGGHPTAAPNYPNAGLPASQPAAATQGLAGFDTSSAPSYDSIQWAHRPIPSNEPGPPEQGGSNASHGAGMEDIRNLEQLEEYVPEIKKKIAQNWSWHEVNAAYCPRYNYFSMRDSLQRRGCKLWKRDQDTQLEMLRMNGHDWAQVCGQLTGPPRTEEEVELRFQWLTTRKDANWVIGQVYKEEEQGQRAH